MAQLETNLWIEKFSREIGFKSAIILHGNVADLIKDPLDDKNYRSVINTIIPLIEQKGYERIVKWDRIDGIDTNFDSIEETKPKKRAKKDLFDMGDDLDHIVPEKHLSDPDDFFSKMLEKIKTENKSTAYILDYSDYIFGNANALSEKERRYLTLLGKSLQFAQNYENYSKQLNDLSHLIIIVVHERSTIPPAFYLKNPLVSTIDIPLPGRPEREAFIFALQREIRVSQNITKDEVAKNDFIDALDGLTLKEIAQMIKLSKQIEGDPLSFEKLINLYKYGEKVCPWEELSKDKLTELESRLMKRVKGQDEAIGKVKDVIIRAFTGFSGLQHSSKQKKPKGTLFFVGPTGVGKTELAKSLAEFVFGDENACIRFDMSEFNHEHSDQRLVGAPPGYVGYEEGGQLTNAVKARPFSVLLFDEIEKAHPKILDKFLQILEDGRLTDGKGETVLFSECIIIFTSNIGASESNPEMEAAKNRQYFIEKVHEHFIHQLGRPELLNRIGNNVIAFNFIKEASVFEEIVRAKFKPIAEFMKERHEATLIFKDEKEVIKAIAKDANPAHGGRGVLNLLESRLVNQLADFVFYNSELIYGRKIEISLRNKNSAWLKFDVV